MPLCKQTMFILAGAGACALALAGCTRQSADAGAAAPYRFEGQPRAILEPVAIKVSRDPKLFVGPSGTIYLLAVHGQHGESQLGLSISHDGGDTFGLPVPVSARGASINSHGENSPVLAATPTEIYAVWEQTGQQGNELMFARSLSFGHHFEPPVRVTDKRKPSFNGYATAAVAPNGDVYVVWLDGRDAPALPDTFSLYLARSRDRGASFDPNVSVASGTCPCCRPAIAIGADGGLHVFWRKVYPDNIRDIAVSTSLDGGHTFSEPVRVAEDNWQINGCPDSGPAAAVSRGRLYVAWMTETTSQRPGVKLSWSDDGGKAFAPARDASQSILDANRPALAVADNGDLLLAFHGRSESTGKAWSPLTPFVVSVSRDRNLSIPGGVSEGAKPGTHASVAMGTAGRVFVAWTARSEGASHVLLSRGRKQN
ncbi:MAG: glycoside hydrolase [Gemmataceae bacterium]|nr:glycoside hydrolase [Gemmataceae bacterium]